MANQTIHKYPFKVTDKVSISMPADAEVLCVQVQPDTGPCIWALVDREKPQCMKNFRVFGTGQPVEKEATRFYVGTFQLLEGTLVFHLFEEAA